MTEKIAAIYLRLSDEDPEKDESGSITSQRELLKAYVAGQEDLAGYRLVEFCDDGYSGTDFERPQVKKLLTLVKQGMVSCILVKDFSRFGRNYIEVGHYLEQIFPCLGVRFVAVNDRYDSGKRTWQGEFMDTAFKNLVYDLYSKDLSEKIVSVRRAKAGQGKFVTGFAPYGYRKSPDQKLIVDPETSLVVKRIFGMASEGIAKTHIARILNQEGIPNPSTVRNLRNERFFRKLASERSVWSGAVVSHILKDQRYVGDAVYGKGKPVTVGSRKTQPVPREEWIVVQDHHEPVVSRELFEQVNAMFKKHSGYRKREGLLFAGKVRCGACNHIISEKHGRYRCRLPEVAAGYGCCEEAVKEEQMREAVLALLRRLNGLCPESGYEEQRGEPGRERIRQLENRLSRCDMEMMRVRGVRLKKYEEYKHGLMAKEKFMRCKAEWEEEEAGLSAEREEVGKELSSLWTASDSGCLGGPLLCGEAKEKKPPFEALTKAMVQTLVRQLVISPEGELKIVWDFQDVFR